MYYELSASPHAPAAIWLDVYIPRLADTLAVINPRATPIWVYASDLPLHLTFVRYGRGVRNSAYMHGIWHHGL